MATLTATAFSRPAREAIPGVNSVSVTYTSGATEISASATTIFLCRVPNHCKILDIMEHHTTGADACPVDYGVDADLDALATAVTQATRNRATSPLMPYQVSLTDAATPQYSIVKATATPGTATASLKIRCTVLFQPNSDGNDV